ncbi:MAG: formylmethanofuran--tetrahydromethanopterin formyltransferase, partial [Methanobacterium sp.]|nr:formylmethanofuran--tetrahydromethanopterin formyltransferase [Methanobacterium sp.]
VLEVDDVLGVSAGNYQGKLGDYHINLRDLF